jgi:hypothetical protein
MQIHVPLAILPQPQLQAPRISLPSASWQLDPALHMYRRFGFLFSPPLTLTWLPPLPRVPFTALDPPPSPPPRAPLHLYCIPPHTHVRALQQATSTSVSVNGTDTRPRTPPTQPRYNNAQGKGTNKAPREYPHTRARKLNSRTMHHTSADFHSAQRTAHCALGVIRE